ncbi:MAG TPA: bifunctional diaminohydroxyphosphoribosylaminopyrimidine deaminase/5-amino-6-(5-phosphoribosylamino)uracil reductase RibD [Methylophilaceae bacterium]|nr:bifunctional diaminohydroxyphosphoribosylaminopyrimidine deaminase/5-amino-6-(5-phosphoribosylamino)uracil reductase RibD [Methylophilaceae bacterium]
MFTSADHRYMTQALRLAEQGLYTTTPNPRVGCVIVKDGVVVGEGAHLKAGEPHAEVYALRQAGEQARGADAYVTLEPCSHHGRTPPCADALVKAGVKRVIAAMQDPNPKVAGRGLAQLQANGIETASGLMKTQAEELNAGFISRMTRGMPFVRTKIAASLDGRTALANGDSKWITGDAARQDVQYWRALSCAILTGVGTVLADDPRMNVRDLACLKASDGRQPLRVVVDSSLRISPDAKILHDGHALIVYSSNPHNKLAALQKTGATLLEMPNDQGNVCLKSLLEALAAREINELMVEAGQGINGALLEHCLIDEFLFYYAPVLMGNAAKGMFGIPSLTDMQLRSQLEMTELRQIGNDIRIRAKPVATKAGS